MITLQCRNIRWGLVWTHPKSRLPLRAWKTTSAPLRSDQIAEMLANPSWSVKSLSTTSDESEPGAIISQKQLHHLLRLSALPLPTTAEEEAGMIKTLESQLHFVRAIQSIDTTGIEPLQGIRDETKEAIKENTVTLESLRADLEKEEVVGYSKRIRRKKNLEPLWEEANEWDPLALASKKIGRYIVVETGKRRETDTG